MGRRHIFALATLATVAACGAEPTPLERTRQIWRELQQLGISAPLTPDPWLQPALQPLAGICPRGGRLVVSMVHTDAFEADQDAVDITLPPNGQTTGHLVYALAACANSDEMALTGTLRRSFHAVQRQVALADPEASMDQELASAETDTFYGALSITGHDEFACTVDMMRTMGRSSRQTQISWVQWQGTLCGHDAATLSKD